MKKIEYCFYFLVLFFTASMIDWNPGPHQFYLGKLKGLFLFSLPIVFLYFYRRLHWSVAVFVTYSLGQFIIYEYPAYGAIPVFLLLGILFMAIQLYSRVPVEVLGKWLTYIAVVQALIAIPQRFGYHLLFMPREDWAMNMALGTVGQHTLLGVLFLLGLAPALWQRRWISLTLIVIGAVVADSTMTLGGLVVVGLFYLWYRGRPLTALLLFTFGGIGAIAGAVFLSEKFPIFSNTGRIPVWQLGWETFKKSPIFGLGPLGSWKHFLVQNEILIEHKRPSALHSEYLQVLVGQGLITFWVYMLALAQFIKNLRPSWHHATIAAILVNALANMPFQEVPLAGVVVAALWAHILRPKTESSYRWVDVSRI